MVNIFAVISEETNAVVGKFVRHSFEKVKLNGLLLQYVSPELSEDAEDFPSWENGQIVKTEKVRLSSSLGHIQEMERMAGHSPENQILIRKDENTLIKLVSLVC